MYNFVGLYATINVTIINLLKDNASHKKFTIKLEQQVKQTFTTLPSVMLN